MKIKVSGGFTIAVGPPLTIDFTSAVDVHGNPISVSPATLLSVIDATTGIDLFAAAGLPGTWQNRVLTLNPPSPGVTNSDNLFVYVDDGRTAAGDDTVQAFAAAQHADEVAALAVLQLASTENTSRAIRDNVQNFSDRNHADEQKLDADLNAAANQAHQDSTKLDSDVNAAAAQAHTDSGQLDKDLAKISGQLPATLGPNPAAGALLVTLPPDGQFVASVGKPTDAPAPDDTSSAGIVALLRRGLARWTALLGILPTARGQQPSAGSLAVVVAPDQSVIPVSGATPVGQAPVNPPVSVAGMDGGGLKRHILTDANGAVQTAPRSNAPRVTAQGNLGAANATLSLPVDGMGTGIAQIGGTFAGTLTFGCSFDGMATVQALNMRPRGTAGGPPVGSATAPGTFEVNTFGMTHLVVTMSAYTSGAAAVLLVGANGPKIVRVEAPSTDPLPVAGTFSASFSALTFWHEAVAKQGSANIVGTSRASGAAQGQASQWAFFEAIVESSVPGTLTVVNEDQPLFNIVRAVKAGTIDRESVRAFGSSFHAEFLPSASGTASLSTGFTK